MLNSIRRFKTLAQGIFLSVAHEKDNGDDSEDELFNISTNLSHQLATKLSPALAFPLCNRPLKKPKQEVRKVETELVSDEEDAQTKALRLFLFKILHLACNMQPNSASSLDRTDSRFRASPDLDTVRACRLVCKSWNDEVTSIFMHSRKSLLVVNPAHQLQKHKKMQNATQDAEVILNTLKSILVRPDALSPGNSDLSLPPFQLHLPTTLFYKEVENVFIHSVWPHFERSIYELYCSLPADSTMRFYWPKLQLDSLRRIKIKCTNDTQAANKMGGLSHLHNPFVNGNYMYFIQQILNGAENAESFTLHCYAPHFAPALFRMTLPSQIQFMDIPLVKMNEDELKDCLENGKDSCQYLRHLIIRSPQRTYRRDDGISACHASFMLHKYANSVETLELDVAGQEWDHIVWTMRRDYVYDPLKVEIVKPMKKLTSLTLHAGIWEICEMKSYQHLLPQLRNLKLTMITRESQIKTLYQSKSITAERLILSFVSEMPYEVLRGFADNLTNLRELVITVKEMNPGLHLCFQGFLRLRKLHVVYTFCNSEEGKELLTWAVTGVPAEDQKAILNEELTMLDAIKKHEDSPSLRNLQELEQLKLIVKSNSKLDVSIMLRTTFLRMPRLKNVTLSEKSLKIEDEQKDYVRKENQYGLIIVWL